MSVKFTITKATIDDIESLVALVNGAYRGESSKQGWTTEADLLDGQRTDIDSLKEIMLQKENTILKCVDEDGTIIGSVLLETRTHYLYLGMLTVRPDLQAKGIGRKLIEASEAFAKENGISKIIMTVISVRHELIAWYERNGFVTTGETKLFPRDVKFGIQKQALEFIVMKKLL
jgi:predicted N-acetyltransferase YhbS